MSICNSENKKTVLPTDIKKIYQMLANALTKCGYNVEILKKTTEKDAKYLVFYNQSEPIIYVLESSKTFSINEFVSNPYYLYFHLGCLNSDNKAMYSMFFDYSPNIISEILNFINKYKNRFDLLDAPMKTLEVWRKRQNIISLF